MIYAPPNIVDHYNVQRFLAIIKLNNFKQYWIKLKNKQNDRMLLVTTIICSQFVITAYQDNNHTLLKVAKGKLFGSFNNKKTKLDQ